VTIKDSGRLCAVPHDVTTATRARNFLPSAETGPAPRVSCRLAAAEVGCVVRRSVVKRYDRDDGVVEMVADNG